ncbi:MAG: HAMP domain-containing histidine kinase [Clostridiales bacterium]|nr:HAMP domain-containing histidine kinase [Clostridiales bacterium]
MNNLKIRTKITLWFSVVIILVSAISFAVILTISRNAIYTDVQETLKAIVSENIDEIEYYSSLDGKELEFGDQYISYDDGFLEIDDDYLNVSQGVHSCLYDENGELLYGENLIGAPIAQKDSVFEYKFNGTKYYVYNVIPEGDNLEGLTLQGVINEDANKTVLTTIVNLSLLILPIIDLIAIIGCYILSNRIVRPVRKIINSAEEISDGDDLSKRIELPKSHDEIYQLGDTFNKMFARLEKSFMEERQFTADISHELRTPVTTILAQSELSLEKDRTKEEYKDSLSVIKRQSTKMKNMVESMLRLSRLECQEKLKNIDKINLSLLLEEICFERKISDEKNITLENDIREDIFINGDEDMIEILINNLISNAYRYTEENGSVFVSLYQTDENVILSVKDTGIGIEKENLERIFDRFFQENKARNNDDLKYSTGLGLSTVKAIADLHGAHINVESEVGKGSEFKVFFKKI